MSLFDDFQKERAEAREKARAIPEPKKPGFIKRGFQKVAGFFGAEPKKEEPAQAPPSSTFERFQREKGVEPAPEPTTALHRRFQEDTGVIKKEEPAKIVRAPVLEPNFTTINGVRAYVPPPDKKTVGDSAITIKNFKKQFESKLSELDALIAEKKKETPSIFETTPATIGIEFTEERGFDAVGRPRKSADELRREIDVLETAAENYRTVLDADPEDTEFFSSLFQGIKEGLDQPQELIPFLGSGIKAGELTQTVVALKKKNRGEETTDFEEALIQKFVSEQIPIDRGRGYNVGQIVANMPTFLAEFALTSGIFSGIKALATKGLTKSAEKIFIPKWIQTVAPYIIGSAGQTGAFVPQIGEKTAEYMLPNPEVITGGNGDAMIQALDLKGDDFGEAFAKALPVTYIEIFSERLGVVVEKPLGFLQKAILGKWLAKHGITESKTALARILKSGGWNGIIGEVFEEEIANLAQAPIEERPIHLPILTPEGTERLIVETLGIGIFGGLAQISNSSMQIVQRERQEKAPEVVEAPQIIGEEEAPPVEEVPTEEVIPEVEEAPVVIEKEETPVEEEAPPVEEPVEEEPERLEIEPTRRVNELIESYARTEEAVDKINVSLERELPAKERSALDKEVAEFEKGNQSVVKQLSEEIGISEFGVIKALTDFIDIGKRRDGRTITDFYKGLEVEKKEPLLTEKERKELEREEPLIEEPITLDITDQSTDKELTDFIIQANIDKGIKGVKARAVTEDDIQRTRQALEGVKIFNFGTLKETTFTVETDRGNVEVEFRPFFSKPQPENMFSGIHFISLKGDSISETGFKSIQIKGEEVENIKQLEDLMDKEIKGLQEQVKVEVKKPTKKEVIKPEPTKKPRKVKEKVEKKPPTKKRIPREAEESGFVPKNLEEGVSTPQGKKEVDKIIKRSQIAKDLSQKLNVPIRRGKFRKPKAIGIFKHDPAVIRLKERGGNIEVVFHEVGHFLDQEVFRFSNEFKNKKLKDEETELVSEYGGSLANPETRRKEAFAEFLRFYMTSTEKAHKKAPEFFGIFEDKLADFPEVNDVIQEAKGDFARWDEQPATAKVLSQISFEEDKAGLSERVRSKTHHLYEQAIDDLHPIGEFTKMAKKQGAVPSEDNAYMLARNLRGWVGKANTFLEKGTFERKYWKQDDGKIVPVFTGKSFKEILEPIEKEKGVEDFTAYLVAKRSVELAGRDIVTGINKNDAEEAIKELDKKYPDFQGVQDEVIKYQDAVLDFGFENGLYDKKSLDKIKELNKQYVPFYRVHDELQSRGYMGKGMANLGSQVKKIHGSERDIVNPLESIVKNTYSIVNASERNSVMMAMVNLSKRDKELGRMFEEVPISQAKVATINIGEVLENVFGPNDPIIADTPIEVQEQIVNIFRPSFFEKGNSLTVLVGGKKRVFETDPAIHRSLQGLEAENAGLLVKIFSFPAKFLRAGATLAPEFMLRNPARDQMTAMVYSKNNFIPVVDTARGFFSLFNKDSNYWLWRMGGGEHAMMVSLDREYLQKTFDQVVKEKSSLEKDSLKGITTIVKHPLRLLQVVSEFGEQGTRIGEAKKALAKGKDPIEAAFASREITLDFARTGSKTRAINMLVAFWNANIQGTDKMVREFKNHPYQTMLKTFMGITLPSILLYMANRDDPRWKEIPQWQKDLFWIVMTEDHIYRIPKPFELGIIFGSVPERILEYMDTKDPALFDNLKESITNGATPGFIPTALIPIIENITNYNLFLDRDIVPYGKQQLPQEAQYTTYTTETSKLIGKWINYAPAKIDNLIRGYFAGLGNYVIKTSDLILKGTGIAKTKGEEPAQVLADLPLIKAFVIREPVGSSSESVNKFYEKAERAEKGKNFYNQLIKDGKQEEAEQYLTDNPEINISKYLSRVRGMISKLRKQKDRIRESGLLSGEVKQKKMEDLDRLITDYAQKALEMTLK